ncbi:MAG TPA: hypothetical protein VG034_14765 [Acidimicrobiia bacterium]|nr:hypothetical protein [Acidimicrobiia bacterium]
MGRPFTLHDSEDRLWQESMFVAWYDLEHGIGGAHRVGHEVGKGTANLWSGIVTGKGLRWRRRAQAVLLDAADRTEHRFGCGSTAFLAGEHLGLEVRDEDVEADLELDSFYAPTSVWNSAESHTVAATIAPAHAEASGRVRGTVRIAGSAYDVDGFFHRDHSWGIRDWATIVSHRWVVGTFGPDLSFSSLILQGPDHRYIRGGAVVRHGEVTPADDVDIVVFGEADGASHRGGEVTFSLPDEETLHLRCEAIDGLLFDHEGFLTVETLCRVTLDGRDEPGICDFEMSNGVRNVAVAHAFRATATDGLSTRPAE